MKLLDWMRREGVSDVEMATRINEGVVEPCTGYAVKKWKYGERQPQGDKIIRIEEVTGGEVTLRDLASTAPVSQKIAS